MRDCVRYSLLMCVWCIIGVVHTTDLPLSVYEDRSSRFLARVQRQSTDKHPLDFNKLRTYLQTRKQRADQVLAKNDMFLQCAKEELQWYLNSDWMWRLAQHNLAYDPVARIGYYFPRMVAEHYMAMLKHELGCHPKDMDMYDFERSYNANVQYVSRDEFDRQCYLAPVAERDKLRLIASRNFAAAVLKKLSVE